MTEDKLFEIFIEEQLHFDDVEDVRESIRNAINRNNIIHIIKSGVWMGFVTWLEVYKNGRQYIYLNNLFIKKAYESMDNLLFLRKILRNKYPFADFFYWHSAKKK